MVWPLIIGAVASVVGGAISAKGSKDAAKTAAAGSEREIKYLEESRDIARGDQAPYRTAGYAALDRAGEMTGLLDEGGTFGGSTAGATGQGQALTADGSPWGESPWSLGWDNGYVATLDDGTTQYWNEGTNSWQSSRGSAYGSGGSGGGGGGRQGSNIQQRAGGGPLYPPTIGRAVGGQLYNVNELGAESVYSQGSYTRNSNPQTLPQDPTGYVKPAGRAEGGPSSGVRRLEQANIAGRAIGGSMRGTDLHFGGMGGPVGMGGGLGGANTNPDGSLKLYDDATGTGVYTSGPVGMGGAGEGGKPGPGVLTNNPDQGGVASIGTTVGNAVDNFNENGPGETFMGQTGPGGGSAVGGPRENDYNFETDPGYNFRFNEGQRMLERGAAARGGLLSGGFARKAIRYGQDYATNEFSNIYNRIAGIAGVGQTAAGQSGAVTAGIGGQMGNAASQGANSSAYGDMGAANAWANAGNQMAQLPWGDMFNRGGNNGGGTGRPRY